MYKVVVKHADGTIISESTFRDKAAAQAQRDRIARSYERLPSFTVVIRTVG